MQLGLLWRAQRFALVPNNQWNCRCYAGIAWHLDMHGQRGMTDPRFIYLPFNSPLCPKISINISGCVQEIKGKRSFEHVCSPCIPISSVLRKSRSSYSRPTDRSIDRWMDGWMDGSSTFAAWLQLNSEFHTIRYGKTTERGSFLSFCNKLELIAKSALQCFSGVNISTILN